ncbi:MAG: hypothetical protein JXR83_13445 [Deltaproteobacteria bacterium]|nr:hypothetical protein [Deltaproteobacteria bacterium]
MLLQRPDGERHLTSCGGPTMIRAQEATSGALACMLIMVSQQLASGRDAR